MERHVLLSAEASSDLAFCEAALPRVSRTFAATIGLLPRALHEQVLVAYLLCRVADTIEDATALDAARKSRLLARFAAALDRDRPEANDANDAHDAHDALDAHDAHDANDANDSNAARDADAVEVAAAFASPADADQELAREVARVLGAYRALDARVRAAIRPRVREMCDGMATFANPRGAASASGWVTLEGVADLERYCYYVAGTVGHLLTDLFRLSLPRLGAGAERRLGELATSFGLGLQLTNIIQDVGQDSLSGRSFVPRQLCAEEGTSPETLFDPAERPRAEAVLGRLIVKARGHLDDALAYSTALPRRAYGVRRFCLTPLYFAVRTLRLAASDPRRLDPTHRVKIGRPAVRSTLRMTALVAPSNRLARWYYRALAGGERDWGIAARLAPR